MWFGILIIILGVIMGFLQYGGKATASYGGASIEVLAPIAVIIFGIIVLGL